MKRLLSLVVLLGFPVLLHAQAQPGFYFYEDNSFGAFVFEVQESGTVEFNLYDRQTQRSANGTVTPNGSGSFSRVVTILGDNISMSGTFSSNAVTVTFSGDFPAIQLTAQRKESFGHYEIFSGVFDAVIDYDSAGSFGDDLYIFADGQVVIFALRPFSNGIFATYASGQLPASFEAGQDFVVESPVDSSRFTLRVDREAFLLDEDLIFLAGSYTGPPGGGTVSTQRLRTSPGFVPLRIRRPGTVLFEFLNQQPVPSIAVRIDEIIPGETYILQGSYDFVTWTDLREMSFVFRFNVSIFWEDLDTFPGTGFNDDFYFRVITRE